MSSEDRKELYNKVLVDGNKEVDYLDTNKVRYVSNSLPHHLNSFFSKMSRSKEPLATVDLRTSICNGRNVPGSIKYTGSPSVEGWLFEMFTLK